MNFIRTMTCSSCKLFPDYCICGLDPKEDKELIEKYEKLSKEYIEKDFIFWNT